MAKYTEDKRLEDFLDDFGEWSNEEYWRKYYYVPEAQRPSLMAWHAEQQKIADAEAAKAAEFTEDMKRVRAALYTDDVVAKLLAAGFTEWHGYYHHLNQHLSAWVRVQAGMRQKSKTPMYVVSWYDWTMRSHKSLSYEHVDTMLTAAKEKRDACDRVGPATYMN